MTGETKFILGALGVGGALALLRYASLHSGRAGLDRLAIRGRAMVWGIRLGVPAEALMITCAKESGGNPHNYLGDQGLETGPSVGPLQMSRGTAIAEGYVPADISAEDYALYADEAHEGLTFEWGARYLAKLYASRGTLKKAWLGYNGRAYAEEAVTLLGSLYPSSGAVAHV